LADADPAGGLALLPLALIVDPALLPPSSGTAAMAALLVGSLVKRQTQCARREIRAKPSRSKPNFFLVLCLILLQFF
jgi:hypothetical protein